MVTGNYYTDVFHKKEALPESKASKIFIYLLNPKAPNRKTTNFLYRRGGCPQRHNNTVRRQKG